jgi:threonylcarbamoyladenosine tRNA methylthiotransferase MtaB
MAEEPRLMPHLHLSLQAADDTVLKRMKRRHSRAQTFEVIDRMRRARTDVVFGADLIAGFPTETANMFANTLDAITDMGLTYLHVFPFSARPGTPAARMPQVPGAIRRERAAMLRNAGEAVRQRFFTGRVGKTTDVLMEDGKNGRCPYYAPVRLDADAPPGTIVTTRIASVGGDYLTGELAA